MPLAVLTVMAAVVLPGTNIGHPNADGTSTLCNGAGQLRSGGPRKPSRPTTLVRQSTAVSSSLGTDTAVQTDSNPIGDRFLTSGSPVGFDVDSALS